jgi:hypothetical protein
VKKKSHRLQTLGKVAGIAVVSALCVFAASMTSEANRAYVIDRVGYLTGNRSKITVDNDEENEWASMDESEAVEDIFNMLGISLPRMLYRPDGFVYTSYLIDDSASVAELEYDYEGNTIVLMADKEVELKGSQLYSVHGESITVSDMDGMEFEVSITCSADDKEDTPLYTAAWVRDEVLYQFTGRIELDELKKIIQKMQFV